MTLILGGSGQLGTAFRSAIPDAAAPSRAQWDLSDVAAIRRRVIELAPERIINCAAYTAVDAAEDDEEAATVLNGAAVGELAGAADELGVPFVTFSTDYVFDGATPDVCTEATPPNPLSAYGRSKLHGERLALRYSGSLVVRSSWLLSSTHPNFVTRILTRVGEGKVRVVNDQWGRPTMAADLAKATLQALDQETSGLLHLSAVPTTTWYGLAREACRLVGLDVSRVVASSSDEISRPAPRPRHAVLASLHQAALPDWRGGLAIWLAARGQPRVEGSSHPPARPPAT